MEGELCTLEDLGSMIDNFWKDKRVLVTGHTGFKGTWLSILLTKLGANVCGISLPLGPQNRFFIETNIAVSLNSEIYIDISDYFKFKEAITDLKPEIVFHLAAQPLVRESYKSPRSTFLVNTQASIDLMDIIHQLSYKCALVMITTDKVYLNNNSNMAFRESDALGGTDPYSASKAAAELAIHAYQKSFSVNSRNNYSSEMRIASARSGNVIGGGDWAKDRIVPDAIRALSESKSIVIRNPCATRPWQHVLEPLDGYLRLAKALYLAKTTDEYNSYCQAFNFSSLVVSNKSVKDLLEQVFEFWPGSFDCQSDELNLYESEKLSLNSDQAYHILNWFPRWSFKTTVERTVRWYQCYFSDPSDSLNLCYRDIEHFYGGELSV